MSPRLSTLTTSCSSSPVSGPAWTFGRSMVTPCWRIGAVTMKMMSSTSMTSTSGVTLICEIESPPPDDPWSNAMGLLEEVPLRDVEELGAERVHLGGQHAHLSRETVVHDDRRNRSREADGGGDQRLGDARRHRLDARRRGGREAPERRHDAPHRSEQA